MKIDDDNDEIITPVPGLCRINWASSDVSGIFKLALRRSRPTNYINYCCLDGWLDGVGSLTIWRTGNHCDSKIIRCVSSRWKYLTGQCAIFIRLPQTNRSSGTNHTVHTWFLANILNKQHSITQYIYNLFILSTVLDNSNSIN